MARVQFLGGVTQKEGKEGSSKRQSAVVLEVGEEACASHP